jgi:protein-tyrosine phosphatase
LIDLHSHLLPGIDDGSPDLEQSLAMARIAVEEGISIQACTPHIFPGVYNNTGGDIRSRVEQLQLALNEASIPLHLVAGADVHITPNLVQKLQAGEALSLYDSRYVLLETPHHVLPPRTEDVFFELLAAGFVPILTHPERMSWIDRNYEVIRRLVHAGAWMQLTAGALLGKFGPQPRYWSERMLDEGMFHIVATDAHDIERRPPRMREAYDVLCRRVGEEEALHLVLNRPYAILEDQPASALPAPQAVRAPAAAPDESLLRRVAALWRRN